MSPEADVSFDVEAISIAESAISVHLEAVFSFDDAGSTNVKSSFSADVEPFSIGVDDAVRELKAVNDAADVVDDNSVGVAVEGAHDALDDEEVFETDDDADN